MFGYKLTASTYCLAVFRLLSLLCALCCNSSECGMTFVQYKKLCTFFAGSFVGCFFLSIAISKFLPDERINKWQKTSFSPLCQVKNYLDSHCKYFGYLLELFCRRLYQTCHSTVANLLCMAFISIFLFIVKYQKYFLRMIQRLRSTFYVSLRVQHQPHL